MKKSSVLPELDLKIKFNNYIDMHEMNRLIYNIIVTVKLDVDLFDHKMSLHRNIISFFNGFNYNEW